MFPHGGIWKQTFFTPKVVEYRIVQDTPSLLPLWSKEAVV